MSVPMAEGSGNAGLHILPDSLGVWRRGATGMVGGRIERGAQKAGFPTR